jgi:hypothetical protein
MSIQYYINIDQLIYLDILQQEWVSVDVAKTLLFHESIISSSRFLI